MTAEEARKMSDSYYTDNEEFNLNMDSIYYIIDYDIQKSVDKGLYECVSDIGGCYKPWEQIYKERELIEEHYKGLGYKVECLGYDRCSMWDSYKIIW